jgi:arylsulfatase A-like enzyme
MSACGRRTRPSRNLKGARVCNRQSGKNHLGDKDEFLPSKHGFDEFFGNLHHLNAEEDQTGESICQIMLHGRFIR